MTTAFVYKWTHKPTLNWYIGSRTRKGCHTDDGYICSSQSVKPMILNNPHDWERTILFIGEPLEAFNYESMLLDLFDAKNDPRSYNLHNTDGKCTNTGRKLSDETKQKLSKAGKGRPHTKEHSEKISKALTGKVRSEEHSRRISEAKKGKKINISYEARERLRERMRNRVVSDEERQKISDRMKGTKMHLGSKRSEETKIKMSLTAKSKPIVTCPHCEFSGKGSSMKRWHFDNCKLKEKII